MDYQDAFEAAGTLGKAQLANIVMVCVVYIYGGWQTIVPVFTTMKVPFYCADNATGVFLIILLFFAVHVFSNVHI